MPTDHPVLLHIETATTVCAVGVSAGRHLLASKSLNNGYTHAENLTLFIETVMKEADVTFQQLDALTVSKGPGSYTGLRIGVSTAKGLCYALGKPLIAIPTLQALTQSAIALTNASFDLYCPMIDARRMEVYGALFDNQGNPVEPVAAIIVDEHLYASYKPKRICIFGDGAEKCQAITGFELIPNIIPSIQSFVSLGVELFEGKRFEDVAYFEPYYLKDFILGPKKK